MSILSVAVLVSAVVQLPAPGSVAFRAPVVSPTLRAEPSSIVAGQSVTLTLTCPAIGDCHNVFINGSRPTPSGSVYTLTVRPATTTTYTGTMTHAGGAPWPAAMVTVVVTAGPIEVCGDGIDNDNDGLIDEGCTTQPPTEVCGDQIDNDGDGLIDEDCDRPPAPEGLRVIRQADGRASLSWLPVSGVSGYSVCLWAQDLAGVLRAHHCQPVPGAASTVVFVWPYRSGLSWPRYWFTVASYRAFPWVVGAMSLPVPEPQ